VKAHSIIGPLGAVTVSLLRSTSVRRRAVAVIFDVVDIIVVDVDVADVVDVVDVVDEERCAD